MNRIPRGRSLPVVLALAAISIGVAGCGADTSSLSQQRAEQLVSEAHAAGVGQNVTVENAEALYGTSAAAVCDVFNGSGDELNLPGNPAGRYRKAITTDAVEYTRLVVKVYCPERLPRFEALVHKLGTTRSS